MESLHYYINGAKNLARASVTPETPLSRARLEICNACTNSKNKQEKCLCQNCKPYGAHQPGCEQCCGCYYKQKVKLADHQCPVHKW